ncbi:hypothetical protein B0J14DRAFT_654976 [Halenospora varia]|nr:hypothetical protein B0J14DRAFT_654976 [Halenospora varia]
MEPPSAPPPPPPPLNIPPSRARRQLAARLALHSKQNSLNAAENGEQAEEANHQKNLNPFAADEDDDSDNEDGDFTIGDLETEEEGKGHLPPGTGLVGNDESLVDAAKNVGLLPDAITLPSNSNQKAIRASFPSMWPFGNSILSKGPSDFAVGDGNTDYENGNANGSDRNHFRGANANDGDLQSSDDSDSEDEEGYGRERGFGSEGLHRSGKRRLSSTTEAKRRTSLEDDDDDEEVVHVAMAEAEQESHIEKPREGEGDEELVEIQHAEMQGVEAQSEK